MNGQHAVVDDIDRAAVGRVLADWGEAGAIGSMSRLGGLTNRIFRVEAERGAVTVRLPGAGTDAYIDRAAELHNARIAAGLAIGPNILHGGGGAMVSTFYEGRALTPEAVRDEPGTAERMARVLRRVHETPASFASVFDAYEVIAGHLAALTDPPDGMDALIERVGRIEPPGRLMPCHNDPWPENFLDVDGRLYLLDWEYSAMGDPAWDLADVIVESRLDDDATDRFLMAYADGPVEPEMRSRVAAMGPVTDLLWGLWALVQVQDGNHAMDFADYGHRRLRRAARAVAG